MTGSSERTKTVNAAGHFWKGRTGNERRREEMELTINGMYAQSRRSLWRVVLFLAVSVAALCFSDLNPAAMLPDAVRGAMGDAPPVFLIHVVLAVSSLSALVLVAGRVTGDAAAGAGWWQVGMSAVFYPLYAGANMLHEMFPVVFMAGLAILLLEHLVVALDTSRVIREERERTGG